MAQGFRDCCNEYSYFTLTQIPATVSEFETYYIRTTQGLTFCASYVNIPPLNYEIPEYSSLEITQQVDCDTCINLYPCTTDEAIILEQFGEGSIVNTYDCNFSTILPMNVNCLSVNPTFNNANDGQVIVSTTGGVPPYTFTVNSSQVVNYTRIDNRYILLPNAAVGVYNITITDSNGDFIIPLQCELIAPPPPPIVECNTTDATFYGKPDGLLDFTIIDGTPPFTFYLNGTQINLPYEIGAGTYTIFFTDQYYQDSIVCEIGQPPEIQYPDVLCMTLIITIPAIGCTEQFSLNFYKEFTKYNYRAWYSCSNPQIIGLNALEIKWEEIDISGNPIEPGWYTSTETFNSGIQWTTPCFAAIPSSGNPSVKFKKSSIIPTPLNEQPTGAWSQVSGEFTATNIVVTQDVCPPVARVLSTTNYCNDVSPSQGSALASAEGGSGPPYTFTVRFTNNVPYITYPPGSVSLTNLFPQDYLLTVTDGQGNESLPVPFTINLQNGFVFDSSSVRTCVRYDYTSEWVNGFQYPSGGAYIESGEEFVDYIRTASNFDFSGLPIGFQLSAKLVFDVFYSVEVGQIGYNDPNLVFSDLPNITFGVLNVTTNSIPSGNLQMTQSNTTLPYTLNGNWYYTGFGNGCCGDPSVEGLQYQRNVRYVSNQIIINNTTIISTDILNKIVNRIPYYRVNSRLCGLTAFCGGQINVTVKFNLEGITKLNGCGQVNNSLINIYSYIFRNNSFTPYSPTWPLLPSPSCGGGGK